MRIESESVGESGFEGEQTQASGKDVVDSSAEVLLRI